MGNNQSSNRVILNDQDFWQLKKQCKENNNELFVDNTFPANDNSLCNNQKNKNIQWLRPKQICEDPKFILDESSRHDIGQGIIGNCWFMATMANLADNPKYFDRVVLKDQNFDADDYVGIFLFQLWSSQPSNAGEWVEVVIDDRLPCTKDGQLIYARSERNSNDHEKQKHEFWPALLEKAYAKLHGSYDDLDGGDMNEAAVNFTGGIPEWIDSNTNDQREQDKLFDILLKASDRLAFMGSAVKEVYLKGDQNLQGLLTNHAYTITNFVEFRSLSRSCTTKYRLVRLRDPWGQSDNEWKGEWSRNSKKWNNISAQWQKTLGKKTEDGEFYMAFEDFVKYFGKLSICHLKPGCFDGSGKKHFSEITFKGEWKGQSAGGYPISGSKIDLEFFNKNPKFFFELRSSKPQCSVVISLMQCFENRQQDNKNQIGFTIFKCGDITNNQRNEWIRIEKGVQYRIKDVTKKAQLTEGKYCIIPYSQNRGDSGDFLLRIFAEKSWSLSKITNNEESSEMEMMPGIQYIPVRVYGDGLTKAIPEVRNTFTLENHISNVFVGYSYDESMGLKKENDGDDVHYTIKAGAKGTLSISVTIGNENILGSPYEVNVA